MQAAIPFPDISPEVFTLPVFGMEFSLRWYALAYIAGIIIGWRLVVAAVRKHPTRDRSRSCRWDRHPPLEQYYLLHRSP